jgi:hypothetical protein
MQKPTTATVAMVFVASLILVAGAAVSLAQSADFHSASASVIGSGALLVTWDERGLGNGGADGNVHYVLTADASAEYGCINGGQKHPKASNKETVSGPLSADITLPVSKNGRIIGSLTVGPLDAGDFSCPNGQTLVLGSVSYSNVSLTDTTNGSTADISGSFSRVFVNF